MPFSYTIQTSFSICLDCYIYNIYFVYIYNIFFYCLVEVESLELELTSLNINQSLDFSPTHSQQQLLKVYLFIYKSSLVYLKKKQSNPKLNCPFVF